MKIVVIENTEQLHIVYQQYNLQVRSPFHDVFFVSEICSNLSGRIICITNENEILLSAFTMNEKKQMAICEIPGDPFITNQPTTNQHITNQNTIISLLPGPIEMVPKKSHTLEMVSEKSRIVEMISEKLKCPLYFPLVYEDSLSFDFLKSQYNIRSWKRLPSLIISAQSVENGLAQTAFERIGSRATKRIRKFNKGGFKIVTATGAEAMSMIKAVEQASWKGQAGQDMMSREQLHLYEALNRSPDSLVRVVLDKDVPVAYRFDYRAADVAYILKWSYNEQYKQYSPGFYLLVEDMARCWKDKNIRFIDLYGSPDTLKTSICDPGIARERHDFAWPEQSLEQSPQQSAKQSPQRSPEQSLEESPEQSPQQSPEQSLEELMQERLRHDQKITIALENSKSLKSIYLNVNLP